MSVELPRNVRSTAQGRGDAPSAAPDLARREDFRLGSATIRPSVRTVEGATGSVATEPRIMQVLLVLADARGAVLTRDDLMRSCWNGAIVTEDAINRTIADIRRVARQAGGGFGIETIPRIGYRLTVDTPAPPATQPASAAAQLPSRTMEPKPSQATRRWIVGGALATAAGAGFLGIQHLLGPRPDPHFDALIGEGMEALRAEWPGKGRQGVAQFSEAVHLQPGNARAWGMLSLAHAAEAEFGTDGAFSQGQDAARKALDLDKGEPNARTALASLLRGSPDTWYETEQKLLAVLKDDPRNRWALNRLSALLQAAGYSRDSSDVSGKALRLDEEASTMSAGPLSRNAFKLWIAGEDDAAHESAIRAWRDFHPHPLAWKALLLIRAFTGRTGAVQGMLTERPDFAEGQLTGNHGVAMWQAVLPALQAPSEGNRRIARNAIQATDLKSYTLQMHAVLLLSHLHEVDAAYAVYEGMLHGKGDQVVSDYAQDPQWRHTLWLFTPAMRSFRADRRMKDKTRLLGLDEYWNQRQKEPDEGRTYTFPS